LNKTNFFDNQKAILFHEEAGYELRTSVYACIETGDEKGINSVVDAYLHALEENISENLDYLKVSILYIFGQLQMLAIHNGIPLKQIHIDQMAYYAALDTAMTPKEATALLGSQCKEFTKKIAVLKQESQYSTLVKQCCDFIQHHLYEDIDIAHVAEELHFSKSYISQKFKAETGIPMDKYIRQLKIKEAKLLMNTDVPLAEIAQTLGFSSQSHFSTTFKKETGHTPLQYKKIGH